MYFCVRKVPLEVVKDNILNSYLSGSLTIAIDFKFIHQGMSTKESREKILFNLPHPFIFLLLCMF